MYFLKMKHGDDSVFNSQPYDWEYAVDLLIRTIGFITDYKSAELINCTSKEVALSMRTIR